MGLYTSLYYHGLLSVMWSDIKFYTLCVFDRSVGLLKLIRFYSDDIMNESLCCYVTSSRGNWI